MLKDGLTDMTNLIVTFCNFANTPKNRKPYTEIARCIPNLYSASTQYFSCDAQVILKVHAVACVGCHAKCLPNCSVLTKSEILKPPTRIAKYSTSLFPNALI